MLSKLPDAKPSGNGWIACCPAHEDRSPSLSITEGDDGRALIKCHAKCTTAAICAALGMSMSDLFADSRGKKSGKSQSQSAPMPKGERFATLKSAVAKWEGRLGPVSHQWEYHNANGEIVGAVLRWNLPDGEKEIRPVSRYGALWVACGMPDPRPLYRLTDLPNATRVYVCEGEKATDAIRALGLVATTSPHGAQSPRKADWTPLAGKEIIILPDHDSAGADYAGKVASILARLTPAPVVKLVELPDLPEGGDAVEFAAARAAASADDLRRTVEDLADAAEVWAPSPSTGGDKKGQGKREESTPSASTVLVQTAIAYGAELWHDANGEPFASMPVGEHVQSHKLRSRAVKQWLARLYFYAEEKAASSQAITDAMNVLEAKALYDGAEHPAPLRLAEHEGRIYIDLADASWRAVEIDATGWRVVDNPPVRFRRTKAMLPLPLPEQGGALDALRDYVNVDAAGWPLVAAWLVAAARPTGPYPVLCLSAEQGSGKTTAASCLRKLIDPNGAELRDMPRNPHELMIAATNGWVIGYDNLSVVPGWLSDCLCRLATGAGFSARQLYSDDEETILAATRPAMLTGIEDLLVRGDLLDRALLVNLLRIPPERRRTEREFWRSFDAQRPRLLGALLTAVSTAMRRLPNVRLDELPRMADFAEWATAAEPALGLADGEFLRTYNQNRQAANELAIEASPVAGVVYLLMQGDEVWTGTAKELLAELETMADESVKRQRGWPGTPKALAGALRRLAPNLRGMGIDVDLTQRSADRQRRRLVALTRFCLQTSARIVQRTRNADESGYVADVAPDTSTRWESGNKENAAASNGSADDAGTLDAEKQTKSFGGRVADDSGHVADANAALSMAADDAAWGEI